MTTWYKVPVLAVIEVQADSEDEARHLVRNIPDETELTRSDNYDLTFVGYISMIMEDV